MKSILRTLLTLALLMFCGCAHYYYMPEISGNGAMYGRGGVIYSIPPQETELKMKLVSLGVRKSPSAAHAAAGSKMIHIRMYVVRTTKTPVPAYINPKEQVVTLPNGAEIRPSLVHARTRKRPLIELSDSKKQAVEFFFPLANVAKSARYIQSFSLHWKIHYGNTAEERTVRFDRQDTRPQQGAEIAPGDPLYPFDESPEILQDDWAGDGFGWWGMPL